MALSRSLDSLRSETGLKVVDGKKMDDKAVGPGGVASPGLG